MPEITIKILHQNLISLGEDLEYIITMPPNIRKTHISNIIETERINEIINQILLGHSLGQKYIKKTNFGTNIPENK